MFISWGSSHKAAYVGDAGVRHCSACDEDSTFAHFVDYTVRHQYWVFRWTTGRNPVLVCENCNTTYSAGAEDFDSAETGKAIPLWDRRGWMVGVGGIAALIAALPFARVADTAIDKLFVADPRAGDLYETNLAKLMPDPDAPRMYGAMRVVRADSRTVEVEIPKAYYGDLLSVQRDVSVGKTDDASYYAPEHLTFSRDSIRKLYADGVVENVRR